MITVQTQPTHTSCGPTVVAMIVGVPVETVLAALPAVRKRSKRSHGTNYGELLRLLAPYGYRLGRRLHDLLPETGMAILRVAKPRSGNWHWLLLADGVVYDSAEGATIPLDSFSRDHVSWYEVVKMLQAGQIINYDNALYRVDYVNHCRARIVPLAKRHVTLTDGREFDAERAGVNISPEAVVPIVTDIERARAELELAEAEAQLKAVAAELARETRLAAQPTPAAARPAGLPQAASRNGGWRVVAGRPLDFRAGSLAAEVIGWIQAHPGQVTKEIVAAVKSEGNVASCVSRFYQSGLIERG